MAFAVLQALEREEWKAKGAALEGEIQRLLAQLQAKRAEQQTCLEEVQLPSRSSPCTNPAPPNHVSKPTRRKAFSPPSHLGVTNPATLLA